jgi:type IV pilus assembly protein PilF
MRFGRLGAAALALAAGCATEPEAPPLKPAVVTTGQEAPQRERARIHTELAAEYYGLGNMSVALEEVKLALSADAAYAPAHGVAGLVYAALKEDGLAEESFQRALRLSPNDHDINHNYGWFLCQRGREKDAIGYFLAAVRNPFYRTPERSYVNAGICARRSGDLAAAENYFRQALAVRPNLPAALFQLADLAYARGDYPGAMALLERLTQLAQPTPEVLWLGVRLGRRLGDRNAEASYALQLRRNFPESKEARALLEGRME